MAKSKYLKAWRQFMWSDPGWSTAVYPACGDGFAVVMEKVDRYGRKMYGRTIAEYTRKSDAQKTCDRLLARRNAMLALAYP